MKRSQQLQSLDPQPQLSQLPSQRIRARTSAPLLDALTPVLPLFHSFLTDDDAARTSRTAALALLPVYAFSSHVFEPPPLALGSTSTYWGHARSVPLPATGRTQSSSEPLWEVERGRQLARWVNDIDGVDPPLPSVDDLTSELNCSLLSGLLPEGLRLLLCTGVYNQPLLPGSLLSILTFLQLSHLFDQPVAPGVLPASLLYLSVQGPIDDHHQLLQRSLAVSLEQLSLCDWPHALQDEVRPAGLQALHLGKFDHPLQPHALPCSLLYLLFQSFNRPLLPDVLPSCLINLNPADMFDQPLAPGVLPLSLRRLTLDPPSARRCRWARCQRGCSSSASVRARHALPAGIILSPVQSGCRRSTKTRASRRCCRWGRRSVVHLR